MSDGAPEPKPPTSAEMQAAKRVVGYFKCEVRRWLSYEGSAMPGRREVEQKLAGAEAVVAAMKETVHGKR